MLASRGGRLHIRQMRAPYQIKPAKSASEIAAVAAMFRTYAASLEIDLAYQDFEAELAGLPGRYAPPRGALLLGEDAQGEAIGCVGVRAIAPDGCCEMKRLYVVPAGRGVGLGRALAEAAIGQARRIGYREMRLDTLPTMAGALSLYASLGFVPIAAYYPTPVAGTVFLSLSL